MEIAARLVGAFRPSRRPRRRSASAPTVVELMSSSFDPSISALRQAVPCAPLAACQPVVPRESRRSDAGFTLLELLMVIAVVAILTAVVMPWSESSSQETMAAAAQTVATDFAYARSLAVANNSSYVVHFDTGQNRYILEHCGTNTALDTLPDSVFRDSDDPPDQHIVRLDTLPGIGRPVKLANVFHAGSTLETVNNIEFGPLGETTKTGYSIVLLTLGSDSPQRYALVLVNPITGLASIYTPSQALPSDLPSDTIQAIETMLGTL